MCRFIHNWVKVSRRARKAHESKVLFYLQSYYKIHTPTRTKSHQYRLYKNEMTSSFFYLRLPTFRWFKILITDHLNFLWKLPKCIASSVAASCRNNLKPTWLDFLADVRPGTTSKRNNNVMWQPCGQNACCTETTAFNLQFQLGTFATNHLPSPLNYYYVCSVHIWKRKIQTTILYKI